MDYITIRAEVVELADTLCSGRSKPSFDTESQDEV